MSVATSNYTAAWDGRVFHKLKRFFRSPKGLLIVIFAAMLTVSVPELGSHGTLTRLGAAIGAASAVDLAAIRWLTGKWRIPDGAILSGAIVAMLLSPTEPLVVVGATAVLAVTTKHLLRVGPANLFNPAALAIVLSSLLFHSVQDWWGALPDFGWAGVVILVAAGGFIADRINKMPLVLVFLGSYYLLFTAMSLAGDGRNPAEIFRAPDLQMALFFAFFMLDDPPTCPVRYRHQVAFGLIVAVSCFVFFELFGWVYFLPAGLLIGNAAEGGRRWLAQRRHQRARAASSRRLAGAA